MNSSQIFGILLFIIGVVLLGFGINATQSLTEKVVEGVSGKYTNETMWYILGGLAFVVVGGLLAFRRKPN